MPTPAVDAPVEQPASIVAPTEKQPRARSSWFRSWIAHFFKSARAQRAARTEATAQNRNASRLSGRSFVSPASTLSPEERRQRYWTSRIRSDYTPYFEEAEIAAERQESITALLIEERLTLDDIFDLGKKRSLTYAEHSKLRAEFSRETQDAISALLTAEQLARFQTYRGNLIRDELITQTVAQFDARKITYSAETTDQIRDTLKKFPPGRATQDAFTSYAAKKILTPEQTAILESVLDKYYVRK